MWGLIEYSLIKEGEASYNCRSNRYHLISLPLGLALSVGSRSIWRQLANYTHQKMLKLIQLWWTEACGKMWVS